MDDFLCATFALTAASHGEVSVNGGSSATYDTYKDEVVFDDLVAFFAPTLAVSQRFGMPTHSTTPDR